MHEWFGVIGDLGGDDDSAEATRRATATSRGSWAPPLAVLSHLAWQAFESHAQGGGLPWVVWIGKRCWPYPRWLIRPRHGQDADLRLLRHVIYVDPPDAASRLWAIDLAARSSAVTAVVADGSGFDMAATRRLQLVAAEHETTILLARPPREITQLSAAATRWVVTHRPVQAVERTCPRWRLTLLRCKGGALAGVSNFAGQSMFWDVEWQHGTGLVAVPADVVDRSGASETAIPARRDERRSA